MHHWQFHFHWFLEREWGLRGHRCPVLGPAVRFHASASAAARRVLLQPRRFRFNSDPGPLAFGRSSGRIRRLPTGCCGERAAGPPNMLNGGRAGTKERGRCPVRSSAPNSSLSVLCAGTRQPRHCPGCGGASLDQATDPRIDPCRLRHYPFRTVFFALNGLIPGPRRLHNLPNGRYMIKEAELIR